MKFLAFLVATVTFTLLASLLPARSFANSVDSGGARLEALVREGQKTYSRQVLAFSTEIKDFSGQAQELECRDQAFFLISPTSLYTGWSVSRADEFRESGGKFHAYRFASCRNAKTEALLWFPEEHSDNLSVTDQLVEKDYDPSRLPMVMQLRDLKNGQRSYLSCNKPLSRTLISKADTHQTVRLSTECEPTPSLLPTALGPMDFISNPGPFAAVSSYEPWMLPAVASDEESFAHATQALLSHVEVGTYNGVMSSLSKLCKIEVSVTDNALLVNHTMGEKNPRTRRLELKFSQLLGFVEGDLYKDPTRVVGEPIGRFAAAEFYVERDKSVVVRFERATNLDGQTIRINGAETYCRRLKKQ